MVSKSPVHVEMPALTNPPTTPASSALRRPSRRAPLYFATLALALVGCSEGTDTGWSGGRLSLPPVLADGMLVAYAAPQEASPRPGGDRKPLVEDKTLREFDNDCTRSGCHASLKSKTWVHAPVAVGACAVCHLPAGKPEEHRFQPTRPKETSCSFCHRPPKPLEHVHAPFGDSNCTGCHDPHGGSSRALLVSADESKVCGSCHDATRHPPTPVPAKPGDAADPSRVVRTTEDTPKTDPYAVLHAPIQEGKCLACHKAHDSEHASLLVASERDLCTSCHQETEKRLTALAHRHEPVETGCVSCHGGHGGKDQRLLRQDTREFCLGCHETTRKALSEHPDEIHGAISSELSCLACHRGHGAETEALTSRNLQKACMSCHDKPIETASGRKIDGLLEELTEAKHFHGPVNSGECQACHRSHTSEHDSLLTKSHPSEPYVRFSETAYELCFSCHEKSLVEEPTGKASAFRDGERNLHYLHVHRDKGRSCNLCHATHASRSAKLMREEVEFGPGGWKLRIEFRPTENGGSCGPGCHQAMSYDRRERSETGEDSRSGDEEKE